MASWCGALWKLKENTTRRCLLIHRCTKEKPLCFCCIWMRLTQLSYGATLFVLSFGCWFKDSFPLWRCPTFIHPSWDDVKTDFCVTPPKKNNSPFPMPGATSLLCHFQCAELPLKICISSGRWASESCPSSCGSRFHRVFMSGAPFVSPVIHSTLTESLQRCSDSSLETWPILTRPSSADSLLRCRTRLFHLWQSAAWSRSSPHVPHRNLVLLCLDRVFKWMDPHCPFQSFWGPFGVEWCMCLVVLVASFCSRHVSLLMETPKI